MAILAIAGEDAPGATCCPLNATRCLLATTGQVGVKKTVHSLLARGDKQIAGSGKQRSCSLYSASACGR